MTSLRSICAGAQVAESENCRVLLVDKKISTARNIHLNTVRLMA